jgi:hypothetical protein
MATQSHLFSFPLTQAAEAPLGDSAGAVVTCTNASGSVTVPITDPGVDLARKTVCIKGAPIDDG